MVVISVRQYKVGMVSWVSGERRGFQGRIAYVHMIPTCLAMAVEGDFNGFSLGGGGALHKFGGLRV